jgi:hypothetical protein
MQNGAHGFTRAVEYAGVMQSKSTTVESYLASLPPDRRAALEAVRQAILANLDGDYVEQMQYGMIGYAVPHSVFPAGYHCDPKQPLPFAGLASQKGHMSLYLMSTYMMAGEDEWFRKAWAKTGKKLDMGKACVRFKTLDGVALDVVGEAVRRVPAAKYVANYVAVLDTRTKAAKPGGTSATRAAKATSKAKAAGTKSTKVAAAAKSKSAVKASAKPTARAKRTPAATRTTTAKKKPAAKSSARK